MRNPIWLGALASLMSAACVEPLDDNDDERELEQEGVSLNGVSLNGVSLNGVSLNGVSLNGVSLNGVSINGVSLNGVSLNGTSLTGTRTTGGVMTANSVGSLLNGTLSSGATLQLRIDSAVALTGTNTDVWAYGVSYSTTTGWQPLCGDATVRALQMMGTWGATGAFTASTTNVTFACRGASIAKCVEMGYKPAKGYTNHMLSCVRMLRGDYCGNARPYTITGNQLNVYDALGIQLDTQSTWIREAEWSPNGAVCISNIRKTRFATSGIPVPACVTSNTIPITVGCGTSFPSGTLLISEIP